MIVRRRKDLVCSFESGGDSVHRSVVPCHQNKTVYRCTKLLCGKHRTCHVRGIGVIGIKFFSHPGEKPRCLICINPLSFRHLTKVLIRWDGSGFLRLR